MRILMIGDVVGSGGRKTVSALLPSIRQEFNIDFVSLQGENLAGGFGLTHETVQEMLEAGADVITTGNHVWDKHQFREYLDDNRMPVLRPLNYPQGVPGRGHLKTDKIGIVNLIGRVWVGEFDSPFYVIDELLSSEWAKTLPIIVDFHAEASSEKMALAWHLDGRVTAVVGTHTHVATADCQILNDGTAYVTDLGMVGAFDSIIGMDKEPVLERFLTGINKRLQPIVNGLMKFNSVLIETDKSGRRAISIQRVDREIKI